jgi:hypothetical protein
VGEAKAAARRLGSDHADLHTIFGPTSLAIQGVQVAAELGDGREVLRRARFVEQSRLPPYLLERRTHLLIDVGRGHALACQISQPSNDARSGSYRSGVRMCCTSASTAVSSTVCVHEASGHRRRKARTSGSSSSSYRSALATRSLSSSR